MASALQQAVAIIQLNDYVTLTILVVVGYDYALTFSREIEYIWNKPWSWVSAMFVLVRYVGLYYIIGELLPTGTSKDVRVHVSSPDGNAKNQPCLNSCGILHIVTLWAGIVFFGAADMIMILRIWALYNRARFILGTLLVLYAAEIILLLVQCAIYSTQDNFGQAIAQVLDFSFCVSEGGSSAWGEALDAVQIALGTVMCLFVTFKFIKEVFQAYRAKKQFRLNRYTNLLVREGLVYFLAILVFSLINLLGNLGSIPPYGWQTVISAMVQSIPPFTLIPRFILNLRELYARDLRGRPEGDIDSAFGLSSGFGHGGDAGTIIFANDGQNDDEDQGEGHEEIHMGERGPEDVGGT